MPRVRGVLRHFRREAVAYAVLLAALVLTLLAHEYVERNAEAMERDRFDETVQRTRDDLERRVESYVDTLRGARGLFYASDSVEREEWIGYGSGIDLENRYAGVRFLGYAERIERPSEKRAFESDLSEAYREEEGARPEPALRPEGQRTRYFPLKYVEPLDEVNSRLVGYDFYALPEHRSAMDLARDTGEPQSTGKVYLFAEAPAGSRADLALTEGFVVYLPVYSGGEPTDSAIERRLTLQGFVVGALEAEPVFRGILDEQAGADVMDLEVYDGRMVPSNLLYEGDNVLRASGAEEAPDGSLGGLRGRLGLSVVGADGGRELSDADQRFELTGQEWNLYFEALPGFQESGGSRLPLFVLLSGLAVSLLLFGVTFMLIRSRLRAEEAGQELEDSNRELAATNRELEAFSYSVSHDLRAPLRSIDGFSQILLEDYADELDEEGRDYLGRVRAGSQRMGRLIDDLLGLSRVTRGAMTREVVDLSRVAEEVAEGLEEAWPEREVEFSVQEGLSASGDPRLLRVALENLIGNAFKFSAREPEARVEFGVDEDLSRRGRVPVYYVRDNGAGFDMAYADKLFGAFQRLHGTDEFEGTGIGLATVQRVVHRHGGRIWAEGEVGRGATFYFTLRPGLQLDPTASRPEKEEVRTQ